MSISNIFNSIPGVKKDWKQDWKEDAKQDWKYDWDVTAGSAITLPVNTVLPSVSGFLQVGSELEVSNGTWTGSGITYSYAWYKNGTAIAGATSDAYTLVAGDVGAMIHAVVTATNATGSSTAESASEGPITALAP